MSEKFELIDAKDLPMTEEEDVTVLCVGADGKMKRRDAGSFGGGGYILKPTADEIKPAGRFIGIAADCADMVKAIETGANVMVLIPPNVEYNIPTIKLSTIINWYIEQGLLAGNSYDEMFIFPYAPIPSFLQG